MLGTLVNSGAIILGGMIGLFFGKALSEKMKGTLIQGIGLAVLMIGITMAIKTNNPLIVIASLVIGGIIGEIIDIEERLKNLGQWLESKFTKGKKGGRFTQAFVTTSLIYCVGAMAIMGALESGLKGNNSILYAKSMLDGITAIVFSSSMGFGVLASAIPVAIYQGGIALSAGLLKDILSQPVITEMTATGGLLIVGIGINMLELKEIHVGNLLPAIFVAIPLALIFG